MHRRALLALFASSAAGCLEAFNSTTEQSPSPSTSGTATLTATGETTLAVDDVTVELTAPRVRPSVVAVITSSTHLGVLDAPRTQYFVVDAQSAGATMSEAGLRLHVDGTTVAETFQWVERAESESKGTVAFAVTHGQYSRATFVLDRNKGVDRWRLPKQIVRRLSTPPVFELTSFEVPDSIVAEGDILPVVNGGILSSQKDRFHCHEERFGLSLHVGISHGLSHGVLTCP